MDTVKFNSGNVKMVAHRGVCGIERENTTPAFLAAANRSYYGVETDVHTTKDGKFVLIHDETTKRVSLEKYDINVEESNYEDFSQIILPDLDGSFVRQDIKIPLLSDYVKICKKYDKKCVLELKNKFKKEDIVRMIEEIKALDYLDGMIYISFSMDNCINLRELLPESTIQWLSSKEEDIASNFNLIKEMKLDVDIYYKLLDKKMIEKFHENGILVNCWTCDSKEDAAKLCEMGVDFITTNILE